MKNKSLTKLTALVVLVTMIALVIISGTLAKYTEQYEGTGTAIVAKWTVNIKDLEDNDLSEATTFNLFDKTGVYDLDGVNANNLATATAEVDDDVANGNDTNGNKPIVAPGTWGKVGFKIAVEATNEVTVKYGFDITAIDTELPLEFSIDGENWNSVADIKSGITTDGLYHVAGATVAPRTALAEKEVVLYWRWLYERGTDTTTTDANNKNDTTDGTAGAKTCTITAKLGATQVD